MSKFNVTKQCLALGLSVMLAACASNPTEQFKTAHGEYQLANMKTLDERQRADLFEAIIAGDMANHQKDYQSAMSYYLFAADLSKNQQLIEKSIISAKQASDSLGLEQAAHIWLSNTPNNTQALTLLLSAQIEQQNDSEAVETASKIFTQVTDAEQQFEILQQSLTEQDPRTVFNLLRELRSLYSDNVAVKTSLAKLIMQLANRNKQPSNMLQQSLTRVEEALAIDAMFLPAIRLKSHILVQLRQDDQARNYLSEIFNNHPESAPISHMLGQLLYDLRDYDASISHYTDWLIKKPKDDDARYYLAASHYANGQYENSLAHFEYLFNNNYEAKTIAFYAGDSAVRLKKTDLAIKYLSQIEEGRFLNIAKIQLSGLYASKQQFKQALEILQATPQTNQRDKSQLLVAEIDLLNKHISEDKAKARLEKALKETPENLTLILKKIEIYNLKSKPKELVVLLKKAQSLVKQEEKLHRFNLAAAALLNNNKHYQQSIDWLNNALKNKPQDKDLLYAKALYKEPLGLFKDMIKELKELHTLYPDDLNIQNALGYTLADQNQELEFAQKLIDQAFQGLPDNVAVIDSKGWLAYRRGNTKDAIKYLSQAFKLSPSADIAAHLGEVLWHFDKKDLAKDIWRKGIELDKTNDVLVETLERLKIDL
ncbi:tetratricopeptide repeat protein [Aliikangiella sp. IMCC44359]|uniref:tetratricopeptide repeat protein n=1 Tax=Aliikangiella sp. IMCC44359 TaxID=3459125 RepID=UPI00403AC2E7